MIQSVYAESVLWRTGTRGVEMGGITLQEQGLHVSSL